VVVRQLKPGGQFDQRQMVRRVPVDLVGRGEDEGRLRLDAAGGLEQVERAVRVHTEVGLRVGRGPVVRGLRGGVDHRRELAAVALEQPHDAIGVADVQLHVVELG
jgi:hypothetical protein